MTIRRVPETDLVYYLISYDKKGHERADDPDAGEFGGRMSEVVLDRLARESITDVFFVSHGWKGDVPAAIDQYDRWIGAMASCQEDRRRIRELRPDWRSLLVGLHWPSRPWGDEEQSPDAAVSFGAAPDADPVAALVDDAADKIGDSDEARKALRTIIESGLEDVAPARLSDEVRDAFNTLFAEADLRAAGVDGAPGDDAEAFDPEQAYQAGLEAEAASFSGGGPGGVFSVLRQLSYWKMKKRARRFGESGAADLLRAMQRRAGPDVQFHLMGHSFGCIAISGTVAGGGKALPRPVDSVYLVQGALSYWAYSPEIPIATGKQGYFHSIPRVPLVSGPVLTTLSEHDSAVGRLYPLASQIRGSVSFDPVQPPKYGALGAFGARGLEVKDEVMKPVDETYGFEPGRVYNLEASAVIREGRGVSGAHNDIAKPEVAHAFWEAILTASENKQATREQQREGP